MDLYAVIMAGGSGTRFWPLSRKSQPKQFLPIISESTMIEETVRRLLPCIPPHQICTVANQEHSRNITNLLPDIPTENILVEPQGKNTAPSLILATAAIYLRNPRAVVAALPADHLIRDEALFLKKLSAAAALARDNDSLVTFGIPPTYPATGYGYILFTSSQPINVDNETFYPVQTFKEKPGISQAQAFLDSGNYFWNSGMFLWRAEVLAQKLNQYAPSMFVYWQKLLTALKDNDKGTQSDSIKAAFDEVPSISIDYALMEKAEGVVMGEGGFGWSDVGSWSSLGDIWPRDSHDNALRGENIALESENCILYNPDKFTALIGIKDLIIVNTPDALLVCRKDQDQKVKDIIHKLIEEKKDKIL